MEWRRGYSVNPANDVTRWLRQVVLIADSYKVYLTIHSHYYRAVRLWQTKVTNQTDTHTTHSTFLLNGRKWWIRQVTNVLNIKRISTCSQCQSPFDGLIKATVAFLYSKTLTTPVNDLSHQSMLIPQWVIEYSGIPQSIAMVNVTLRWPHRVTLSSDVSKQTAIATITSHSGWIWWWMGKSVIRHLLFVPMECSNN